MCCIQLTIKIKYVGLRQNESQFIFQTFVKLIHKAIHLKQNKSRFNNNNYTTQNTHNLENSYLAQPLIENISMPLNYAC